MDLCHVHIFSFDCFHVAVACTLIRLVVSGNLFHTVSMHGKLIKFIEILRSFLNIKNVRSFPGTINRVVSRTACVWKRLTERKYSESQSSFMCRIRVILCHLYR